MKRTSMLKPELEERSFGSVYDPLLNGVAQGLAQLFPPVARAAQAAGQRETARPCESRREGTERQETQRQETRREETRRQEAQRSGEEKRGSHTRA